MDRKTRTNIIIACAAALVALALGIGVYHWSGKKEPNLEEFKALVAEEGPPTEERTEAMKKSLEKETGNLNDEQKGKFFYNTLLPALISVQANRLGKEYDKLLAMSEEDRNRELDRRIDEIMRKNTKPTGGNQPGGDKPGPWMSGMSEADREAFALKMLDTLTPEVRAKLDNGSKLMQQRMNQRGITPPDVPGGLFQ